ncbi:AAA family ATPase [Natroniella sulfidigena]|uniref:ATP-binding protein n=1 Tax=Natroniella sulfidigena TaxID=723921 RepID=UPI00200A810A|nr:AAA family ATPase [Natroniella sulfidigena]MCK8816890.1 AAA family ATPase [Natroniella sulfidigena]
MKIAISGKGGVGKTTITATLSKMFSENDYNIFAVDADPDANLATTLGIPEEEAEKIKPLAELEDVIEEKNDGGGAFISLTPKVDDTLDDYAYNLDNIKFLRMGEIKQGGAGCYCKENSFLRSIVESLLTDKEEIVILDMGAGIEHLSRGTSRAVDILIIVIEASQVSIETAQTVKKMAVELGIPAVKVIANKVFDEDAEELIKDNFSDEEILGFIPFNKEVMMSAMTKGSNEQTYQALKADMEVIYNNLLRGGGSK